MADLEAAAHAAGLDALAVEWERLDRADLSGPCILLVKSTESAAEFDHFVACFGERSGHVCLADFPGQPVLVPQARLARYWSGTAIYLDLPDGTRLDDLRWRLWRPTILRWSGVALVAASGCGLLVTLWKRRPRGAVAQRRQPETP